MVAGTTRRPVNVLFSWPRVAVLVDNGCFWHGCPEQGKRVHDINSRYWLAKIDGHRERDSDTDRRQANARWLVIGDWEHNALEAVASRIEVAARGIANTRGRR